MANDLVLITGGAGFIGSNLAHDLLSDGYQVRVLDNVSRPGVHHNVEWLQATHGHNVEVVRADVRDADAVRNAVEDVGVIYHFASQVAVTTSISNPRDDFEINTVGTINLLEAARESRQQPIVAFTSTNKVYGDMADLDVIETESRYTFAQHPHGIDESRPLDFYSPYGCSKGAADQYVHDYSRIYGLPTFVFRMSCIYGTRQFGLEDQGWVAHLMIAALLDRPIRVYGTGKQVRDILWVEDLVRAFRLATDDIDTTAGQIYNIGGGAENTISIWAEFGEMLEELVGRPINHTYQSWRPGDQTIYISDTRKALAHFGWQPSVTSEQGIIALFEWVSEHQSLFTNLGAYSS